MHIVVRFLDTLSTFMTLFILKLMLEVSQIWSMNFANMKVRRKLGAKSQWAKTGDSIPIQNSYR